MCGILAVIGSDDIELARKLSKKMTHRGPDESGIHMDSYRNILCHERLSIIDLTTGRQPILLGEEMSLVHNGEIYNHAELREALKMRYEDSFIYISYDFARISQICITEDARYHKWRDIFQFEKKQNTKHKKTIFVPYMRM